jgi:uncharacterized protein (TIGR03067 family)
MVSIASLLFIGVSLGDDKKGDKELLQGEWAVVSRVSGATGNNLVGPALKQSKLVVNGDEWTRTIAGREQGLKTTFKLDSSKTPKQIDVIGKQNSASKEVTWVGIYKLDGDTLTVCTADRGVERPTELKAGKGFELVVYKRAVAALGSEGVVQDKSPTALPETLLTAWEKAGASAGWISLNQSGHLTFRAGVKGKAGEVAAFSMSEWKRWSLAGLPQPEQAFGLSFSNTEMTDAGMKQLATLKHLRVLDLSATKMTDKQLSEIAGMKQLQSLSLGGTEVTDVGLKSLAGLTQLQALDLSGTKVSTEGLRELAGLKQLQSLSLVGTKVRDGGLKELAGLTKLQLLDLSYTKVTEAGLKDLADLKQLQSLNLSYTEVADTSHKELRKALPKCKIIK